MMDQQQSVEVEILLPVHNEAETIESTVREIYQELSRNLKVRLIICEDGSKDNTKEVLRRLSEEIPMNLMLCAERKGYSRAVRDGMEALKAPYLVCMDSDGQCDPKDFPKLWNVRTASDVVIGWRHPRADPLLRRRSLAVLPVLLSPALPGAGSRPELPLHPGSQRRREEARQGDRRDAAGILVGVCRPAPSARLLDSRGRGASSRAGWRRHAGVHISQDARNLHSPLLGIVSHLV